MAAMNYPRIRIAGAPYERGVQYGRLASKQIAHSLAGYERKFLESGITWGDASKYALRYLSAIEHFHSDLIEEMNGIADGAGIRFSDVLAMNCRTEIMWNQIASKHTPPTPMARAAGECSAIGVDGALMADGSPTIAQNWDWLVDLQESVIVLEVHTDGDPAFVTVVEAGLLAKLSMNSYGLAVTVNTLIGDADHDTEGLPFHILLRALTACANVSECLSYLATTERASSGNFLIGSAEGGVLNIECEPGGIGGLHPSTSSESPVLHTNHFLTPSYSADLAPVAMPDSYVRLARLRRHLYDSANLEIADITDALRDHIEFPNSICCHPDIRQPSHERWATIASAVMRPHKREFLLAEGTPCSTEYQLIDLNGLHGGK